MRVGPFWCLALALASSALAQNPSAPPAGAADQETFFAERQRVHDELRAVRERHRNAPAAMREQALQQWREENKARLAALREQAVRLAQIKPTAEPFLVETVQLPPNATQELEDFLVERADLHNERVLLLNQLRDASAEAKAQALASWHEQNRVRLQAQQARLAARARQSTNRPETTPPAPIIPDGASPNLRSFLIQRHAFALERRNEEDRIRNLPAAEQRLARRQWHARHAQQIATLAEMARTVSNSPELTFHPSPEP